MYCPDFTDDEWDYVEYHAGWVSVAHDCPEELRISILEKMKRHKMNTDPSKLKGRALGKAKEKTESEAEREL